MTLESLLPGDPKDALTRGERAFLALWAVGVSCLYGLSTYSWASRLHGYKVETESLLVPEQALPDRGFPRKCSKRPRFLRSSVRYEVRDPRTKERFE